VRTTADWQARALARLAAEDPGPAPVPDRMYWGRRPENGPGAEVLGVISGQRVIEIGCGPGHHLAHLVARHGAAGLGIDVAPAQVQRARSTYGHLTGITFTSAEATAFLTATTATFDIVMSVFGALSFTDPGLLLPAIRSRLSPRGILAFSVRDDHPGRADTRGWPGQLSAAGFDLQTTRRLADTTLLITARPSPRPPLPAPGRALAAALTPGIDGVSILSPDADGNAPPTHTCHHVAPDLQERVAKDAAARHLHASAARSLLRVLKARRMVFTGPAPRIPQLAGTRRAQQRERSSGEGTSRLIPMIYSTSARAFSRNWRKTSAHADVKTGTSKNHAAAWYRVECLFCPARAVMALGGRPAWPTVEAWIVCPAWAMWICPRYWGSA
jgi:SAM-dependent methyltransferase